MEDTLHLSRGKLTRGSAEYPSKIVCCKYDEERDPETQHDNSDGWVTKTHCENFYDTIEMEHNESGIRKSMNMIIICY